MEFGLEEEKEFNIIKNLLYTLKTYYVNKHINPQCRRKFTQLVLLDVGSR